MNPSYKVLFAVFSFVFKTPRRLFLISFLIFLPIALWHEREPYTWTATVYSDATAPGVSEDIGEYLTLNECREAAAAQIAEEGWSNAGYECGFNCGPLFPFFENMFTICEDVVD